MMQTVAHTEIHLQQFSHVHNKSSPKRRISQREQIPKIKRSISLPLSAGILEEYANVIVAKLEENPHILDDTPIGELKRKETLREMPQCLTMKRTIRRKLSKQVNQHGKIRTINMYRQFKYTIKMSCTKLGIKLRNLIYTLELWYSSLKTIEGHFGASVALYFKFLRWIFLFNTILTLFTVSFVVLPQFCYKSMSHMGNGSFWDVFTGRGFLTDSILFYGFYSNHSVGLLSLDYNMPSAYFFTTITVYLLAFLVLSFRAATEYKKSFIQSEFGVKHKFANKIFCGWDYNITEKRAATLKSAAIYHDLIELIQQSLNDNEKLTKTQTVHNYIKYILVNVFVVLLISLVGFAVWTIEQWNNENVAVVTAIFINILITVFPILFSFIVKYENYRNPTISILITMFRTFLLGFVALGTLFAYILQSTNEMDCWETFLGQHIYLFILYDWIFGVILTTLFDIIHYNIKKSALEFDVSRYSMHLIYNQLLLWFGIFFAPLTTLIITIKLFVLFYIRVFVTKKLCTPSTKPWRATQTHTWLSIQLFLSLFLYICLYSYTMVSLAPSSACGPFRNYNTTLELLTNGVFQLENNHNLFKILLFIRRPGCITLILIAISVGVYYLRERANSQVLLVKMYQDLLFWEREDKAFILKKILKHTDGHFSYNLKERREIDPITSMPNVQLLNQFTMPSTSNTEMNPE